MSKLSRIILLFLFSIFVINAEEIRIIPDDYWLQTQNWEDNLSPSILIESSLVASGLIDDNLTEYINRYEQLLENFKNITKSSFKTLSNYEKGEFILNWTHDKILNNYIEEQTLMDVLIDTGNYNCVSSAVIYLILAKEAGLKIESIETSDHAFCRVETEKGWIDVETTTSFGFNPGIKKDFLQTFNQTGYTYVPPGNYSTRKRITDKDTVALILQNRMSVLQKYNNHDQAIGLSIDRWTFSNTEKNLKDMNDAFRNWSAVLNNQGKYIEAYYFLSEITQKYNLLNKNKDLLYDLAYNQIITLINTDNFDLANNFLIKTESIISSSDQLKLEKLVKRDYLSDIVRNEKYKISLPLVREAYDSGIISKSDWQNWITVLHQNEALLISEKEGWLNAWTFLKDLPSEEKAIRSIYSSIIRAHDNWSFEVHNKFADKFNSHNFDEAEKLLLDALTIDPGNKYLSKDLEDLNKIK